MTVIPTAGGQGRTGVGEDGNGIRGVEEGVEEESKGRTGKPCRVWLNISPAIHPMPIPSRIRPSIAFDMALSSVFGGSDPIPIQLVPDSLNPMLTST